MHRWNDMAIFINWRINRTDIRPHLGGWPHPRAYLLSTVQLKIPYCYIFLHSLSKRGAIIEPKILHVFHLPRATIQQYQDQFQSKTSFNASILKWCGRMVPVAYALCNVWITRLGLDMNDFLTFFISREYCTNSSLRVGGFRRSIHMQSLPCSTA